MHNLKIMSENYLLVEFQYASFTLEPHQQSELIPTDNIFNSIFWTITGIASVNKKT